MGLTARLETPDGLLVCFGPSGLRRTDTGVPLPAFSYQPASLLCCSTGCSMASPRIPSHLDYPKNTSVFPLQAWCSSCPAWCRGWWPRGATPTWSREGPQTGQPWTQRAWGWEQALCGAEWGWGTRKTRGKRGGREGVTVGVRFLVSRDRCKLVVPVPFISVMAGVGPHSGRRPRPAPCPTWSLQALVGVKLLLYTKRAWPCAPLRPSPVCADDHHHCRHRVHAPCRERFGRAFATLREAFGAPAAWRLWFDLAESTA